MRIYDFLVTDHGTRGRSETSLPMTVDVTRGLHSGIDRKRTRSPPFLRYGEETEKRFVRYAGRTPGNDNTQEEIDE